MLVEWKIQLVSFYYSMSLEMVPGISRFSRSLRNPEGSFSDESHSTWIWPLNRPTEIYTKQTLIQYYFRIFINKYIYIQNKSIQHTNIPRQTNIQKVPIFYVYLPLIFSHGTESKTRIILAVPFIKKWFWHCKKNGIYYKHFVCLKIKHKLFCT